MASTGHASEMSVGKGGIAMRARRPKSCGKLNFQKQFFRNDVGLLVRVLAKYGMMIYGSGNFSMLILDSRVIYPKTNILLFPHNPDAFYKLYPEIWIIWSWTSLVTGCPAKPEYRFALRHDGMNTGSDLSDLCPISVLLLQGIAVIAHLLDSLYHPAIGSTRRRTDSDSRTNCTLRKLPCSSRKTQSYSLESFPGNGMRSIRKAFRKLAILIWQL